VSGCFAEKRLSIFCRQSSPNQLPHDLKQQSAKVSGNRGEFFFMWSVYFESLHWAVHSTRLGTTFIDVRHMWLFTTRSRTPPPKRIDVGCTGPPFRLSQFNPLRVVLHFFSEFQVAECQIFDRHFTEKQKFEFTKVRITKCSTRYLFETSKFRLSKDRMH
jgi:hypothetical protein